MIAMTKNMVLKFSLATQAPAKYITNFPGVIGSGGGGLDISKKIPRSIFIAISIYMFLSNPMSIK